MLSLCEILYHEVNDTQLSASKACISYFLEAHSLVDDRITLTAVLLQGLNVKESSSKFLPSLLN